MLTQPEKRLATCPEKTALKNYLLGKLPAEIPDQFEDHFSSCAETAIFLAIELLRNDTSNQLAVEQIVKILFDENMPDWFPTIIFDESIVRTSRQFPKQATAEIIAQFENEKFLERILQCLIDPKRFGMLSNRNNANRPTIESIRIERIQILGKHGKDATTATDWLTK